MKIFKIGHASICKFDGTNCFFAPDSQRTLSGQGARTITISQSKSSSQCTVMIGVTGVGHRIPPYNIYKGSQEGPIRRRLAQPNTHYKEGSNNLVTNFPVSNFYTMHKKAWMESGSWCTGSIRCYVLGVFDQLIRRW
jgi:hypothetical protein